MAAAFTNERCNRRLDSARDYAPLLTLEKLGARPRRRRKLSVYRDRRDVDRQTPRTVLAELLRRCESGLDVRDIHSCGLLEFHRPHVCFLLRRFSRTAAVPVARMSRR